MRMSVTNKNQNERIAKQIEHHFDERVKKYGADLKAIDWKSTEAQYIHFQQLLKLIDSTEFFSINDYGCGNGELINYLKTNYTDFKYFGFDVSTRMLEKAKEIFVADGNCRFTDKIEDLPVADYTVACGVFTMKFIVGDDEWHEYMLEKVTQLSALSRKGFAFNALTLYSDVEFRREDLYYADPLFWFDYCKRNISKYVSLLHDYPQYTFTIIVRK